MSLVACLLWTVFSGSLGGPVQVTNSPFYHLPMFLDAPEPVVAQELFLPVPHRRPVPAGITSLLLPVKRPQQSVQGTGPRAVEVFCGGDQIFVRVDRFQVRSWTNPYLFRLGTCRVSKVSPRFLYFHDRLTECGGESQIVGGQLVYSFTLSYTPPPPQGFAIRVIPLTLPIHCHYNRGSAVIETFSPHSEIKRLLQDLEVRLNELVERIASVTAEKFHYLYKVGFRPQVQHKTILKSIRSKLSFSLTVCNEHWEPVPAGQEFVLGELVYFIAQSRVLLAGESLYVDSCYATSSKDPHSQPRVDIITNYGCMTDSRREGSSSYFLSAGGAVLKFSVDALLFRAVSQVLYLHCSMSVSLTTSHVSKSCNYNTTAGRWEELEASPSVCSCCDSTCTDGQDVIKNTVSSQGWFIGQNAEQKPRMRASSLQADEQREEEEEEEKEDDVRIKEDFRKLRSLPPETNINSDEGKDEAVSEKMPELDERKEWRNSSAVSHQGERETEEEVKQEDNQMKELEADVIILSEQTEKAGNESVSGALNSSEFIEKSSINVQRDYSGNKTFSATNSSFVIDSFNTSSPAGNVSTAAALCPEGDHMNCSSADDGVESYPSGSTNAAVGADLPSKDRAPSDLGRSGSVWDSSVRASPLGSGLETLSESEQAKSANKSFDTESSQIAELADDSEDSKGPDGDDEKLHSLPIRELEPDSHPAGFSGLISRLLGNSGFESGLKDDEALHHLGQFTEAAEPQKEFPGRAHSLSSGLVGSEQQDNPGHSSVVTVTESFPSSESSSMFDWKWAVAKSDWGLEYMMKKPMEG